MTRIESIVCTHLVRRAEDARRQVVRFTVSNDGEAETVGLSVEAGGGAWHADVRAGPGASTHDLLVSEPAGRIAGAATLRRADGSRERRATELSPPRNLTVHLVQTSHHDVGYTDLASTVLEEQARWLEQALDMARDTDSYPPEARFRVVVEQAWSLLEFLKRASAASTREMESRLRQGRFELTALFGNLVTELCGHETLIRAVYPSFALARRFGVSLVSAEHNDVPGISWGLCRVLTDAGISLFCPAIPEYYRWGGLSVPPHWDEKAIFGREGPGAFLWQAPSGRNLLFYCHNGRASGDGFDSPEVLERELSALAQAGYPFSALRWTVSGARRDNAPFSARFCDAVRAWNARWANPRLELSTNARFYAALAPEIPSAALSVHRGELPGQDYPVGSLSSAVATAANRGNHASLPAAELLASAASLATDFRYPEPTIRAAWEDVLWHDEHTWGHHFPAGPTARASAYEKAVHAFRAEALVHDVASKAMARIADAVRPPAVAGAYRLVVFNPLPRERQGVVVAALRELDNCGSEIVTTMDEKSGAGFRRGALLTDRWHVNPDAAVCRGEIRLLDEETGVEVPFQIRTIEDGMAAVPFAAERLGLGSGTRRYGLFEDPAGIRHDLVFVAASVPPCGYRSYLLVPSLGAQPPRAEAGTGSRVIENEWYRIEAREQGGIASVRDLRAGRELLDAAGGYGMLDCVVRSPLGGGKRGVAEWKRCETSVGPVCSTLILEASAPGHPVIRHTVTLWAGRPEIHVATRILKSPEPLLDLHLCFPFAADDAGLAYEGALCVVRPVEDHLPGAASDDLAVQNWVRVADRGHALLWTSLDAPVVSLAELREGAVSPAHRALFDPGTAHVPPGAESYRKGWIFAHLFANNFGTNFLVSQSGDALFRFVIAPCEPGVPAAEAVLRGQELVTPLGSILGSTWRGGSLPPSGSFLRLDPPELALLAWKRAEHCAGHVVRVWNPHGRATRCALSMPGRTIGAASLLTVAEEPSGVELPVEAGAVRLEVPPDSVWTVLIPDGALS